MKIDAIATELPTSAGELTEHLTARSITGPREALEQKGLRLWRQRVTQSQAMARELQELVAALHAGDSCSNTPDGGSDSKAEQRVAQFADDTLEGHLADAKDAASQMSSLPSFHHRRPWLTRRLAIAATRLLRFLSKPLLSQQAEFHEAVLASVALLDKRLRQLSATTQSMRRISEAQRTEHQGLERLEALAFQQILTAQSADLTWQAAHSAGLGVAWPTREGVVQSAGEEALAIALHHRFRGTAELIRSRLSEYLPWVEQARCATPDGPLLDLGCGQGDWLQLLAQNEHVAVGIDANLQMVEHCRALGLNATQADAQSYLMSRDAETFGSLSAFHILEHLPLTEVLELLREAHRVMRPGGLLLIETPNPEWLPGSVGFAIDPTHNRPLASELLIFLTESAGFVDVKVKPLVRDRGVEPLPLLDESADPLVERLNQLTTEVNRHLLSAPDYALLATRPFSR